MNKKEIAIHFAEDMRYEHPEVRITNCEYVTIDGNSETAFSDYAYNVDNAKYTIVCCKYDYTVSTQMDSSAFVLFIDENGHADSKLKIGNWTITMDTPHTGSWRTNGRVLYASYKELRFKLSLKDYKLAEDIANKWPYLLKAMECSTQLELDFLSKLADKEDELKELNQISLRKELELSQKSILLDSYKEILDEIKNLVIKEGTNN